MDEWVVPGGRMRGLLRIGVFIFVGMAMACGEKEYSVSKAPTGENSNQNVINPNKSIDVSQATEIECACGGSVYTVFVDMNGDGVLDSSEAVVSRQVVCNGLNGAPGSDGQNGYSMVFEVVPAPVQVCLAGGNVLLMALDIGRTGVYDISYPSQQSITLCNGQNGQISGYSPVEAIQACGGGGAYREVLLRLANGQVLSSFSEDSGGTMTRLAFLPDGTYMNTDSSGCIFSLATSENGASRSISWNGEVQMTWPLDP